MHLTNGKSSKMMIQETVSWGAELYWDDKIRHILKGATRSTRARKQKIMQKFVQKEMINIYRMLWVKMDEHEIFIYVHPVLILKSLHFAHIVYFYLPLKTHNQLWFFPNHHYRVSFSNGRELCSLWGRKYVMHISFIPCLSPWKKVSIPTKSILDLWCMKWHWERLFS